MSKVGRFGNSSGDHGANHPTNIDFWRENSNIFTFEYQIVAEYFLQ